MTGDQTEHGPKNLKPILSTPAIAPKSRTLRPTGHAMHPHWSSDCPAHHIHKHMCTQAYAPINEHWHKHLRSAVTGSPPVSYRVLASPQECRVPHIADTCLPSVALSPHRNGCGHLFQPQGRGGRYFAAQPSTLAQAVVDTFPPVFGQYW